MNKLLASFFASGLTVESLQLKIVSIQISIGSSSARLEAGSFKYFVHNDIVEGSLARLIEQGRAPFVRVGLYCWAPMNSYDSEFRFVPAVDQVKQVFPNLNRLGYLRVDEMD